MKLKRHFVIYCILLINLVCCTGHSSKNVDFDKESFRKNIKPPVGEVYFHDSLFLGKPRYIQYHPDSFLIVLDMGTKNQIKIIDLKNRKIQEMIPQGKGPGEMISAFGLQIKNRDLFVFCLQLSKVIKLTPDLNRKFFISEEFRIEEKQPLKFYPLKADTFVCISNIESDKRLTFLDSKGKIIRKLGDFPALTNERREKIRGNNDVFGSYITANPEGDKIFLACAYTDLFEIYDMKKMLINRFKGPSGIKLTVHRKNIGKIGWVYQREPPFLAYCKLDSNEDEVWAGYVGFLEDRKKRSAFSDVYPKEIMCFNWKGKPLRRIEFDKPVLAFDFDWTSKVLYTIEWIDENPDIKYYSLRNYF